VRLGYRKRNKAQAYAIKVVQKNGLADKELDDLLCEITIMSKITHANIVRLYKAYEEPEAYYLVQEIMTGGELFDRIVAKECYNEREARDTAKTILGAVDYMQSKKVVHRDLKPENLLLAVRSLSKAPPNDY
jgi:serine/threonine protein kinase